MAWQDTFIIIIRNLTNDFGVTPNLTDDQIVESAVVAGQISSSEFPLKVTYTFDATVPFMGPDPTIAPVDNNAIALWSLKAACIISTNNYIGALGQSIRIKDGDSAIDTTGGLKGYADLLSMGPCSSYRTLFKLLTTRASMSSGRVIMGPNSHGQAPWGNFTMLGNWNTRGFFDYFLRF